MAEPAPRLALWIATCGPVGNTPVAPGSAGSLVGLALAAGITHLPVSEAALFAVQGVVLAAVGILGLWSSRTATRHLQHADPARIVIDEVFGQLVTFLGWANPGWKGFAVGFILFRVMDILKPFPAGRAEHLGGGWGIMLDDAVAGVYSLAILIALRTFWT